MRGYQEKMNDCRKKIRELKGPYIDLKKRQYELNEKRRAMIKQYEQDRQNYAVWAQQNVSDLKLHSFAIQNFSAAFPPSQLQCYTTTRLTILSRLPNTRKHVPNYFATCAILNVNASRSRPVNLLCQVPKTPNLLPTSFPTALNCSKTATPTLVNQVTKP